MKKIILLLIPFLLTGCYNYNELENLGIVSSLYINYEEGYKIIAEVSKDDKPIYYHAQGTSLSDAIRNLNNKSPYYLYYNHLNTLLLSKTAPLDEIVPYLTRNEKINTTFKIVTTDSYKENKNDTGKFIKGILNNSDNKSSDFSYLSKAYYENKEFLLIPNFNNEIKSYSLYKNNKYKASLSNEEINLYNILFNKNDSIISINYQGGILSTQTNSINRNNNTYEIEFTIKELTSDVDTTKIEVINDLELTINNYLENTLNNLNNKYKLLPIKNIKVISHINKKGLILK